MDRRVTRSCDLSCGNLFTHWPPSEAQNIVGMLCVEPLLFCSTLHHNANSSNVVHNVVRRRERHVIPTVIPTVPRYPHAKPAVNCAMVINTTINGGGGNRGDSEAVEGVEYVPVDVRE